MFIDFRERKEGGRERERERKREKERERHQCARQTLISCLPYEP